MSYQAFTRLFWGLLALGMTCAIASCSLQYSSRADRWLFAAFFLAIGAAFGGNTICGLTHEKMQARGGPATRKASGKIGFAILLVLNMALAAMLFVFGVKIAMS